MTVGVRVSPRVFRHACFATRVSPRVFRHAHSARGAGIKGERVQTHISFSLRSRDCVPRPYSGGTATMATGRYVSVPAFRERGLRK